MMEGEIAINDAKQGLNQIISEAENFVQENVSGGGIFGFSGWNDACGQKIGRAVISSVESAVKAHLDLYDCQSKLDSISDNLQDIISVIEAVKEELQ